VFRDRALPRQIRADLARDVMRPAEIAALET
jgi:hypothetical protein